MMRNSQKTQEGTLLGTSHATFQPAKLALDLPAAVKWCFPAQFAYLRATPKKKETTCHGHVPLFDPENRGAMGSKVLSQ
jgi:hypothetical protein